MSSDSTGDLKRSLSLAPTFMIAAGTMLGAGIFVFPGLAGARTGAGAAVSFAAGGTIALLVAMATSELATTLPKSGGIINFARRAYSPSVAGILGIAQWAGLVFATGFYLLGFGSYASALLDQSSIAAWAPGGPWLALTAAVLLTGISIINTEWVGRLQSLLVAGLLIGLAVFLALCLYIPLSGGEPSRELSVAPNGGLSIATTTALIFTSFLGFVQVANLAGDILSPEKTIPRAILGSVVLVTVIYVLVALATSLTFGPDALREYGETALAMVAERRIGAAGRVAVLVGGLLATLSSANASIISASRTLFALGRDRMAPASLSNMSRFDTPMIAIAVSAAPIAGLLFAGNLETLAESASILHLLIYAAICFAVIRLRRRGGGTEKYQMPGYPILPLIAGLLCLALCAFFDTTPIMAAAGSLAAAAIAYAGWNARTRGEISKPDEVK